MPGRSLFLALAFTASPLAAQLPPPSNVTVTEAKGTVSVSWRGVKDESVSYRVLRGTDPRGTGLDLTKPLPYDMTSFSDSKVPTGTVYYTVVAVYGDRSESASPPVPFTAAATAAPVPPPRGGYTGAPLTAAPPLPLRAPALTISSPFIWVTISWPQVLPSVPGPVTYVVRRSTVDPATLPSGTQGGYVTGIPKSKPNGTVEMMDLYADRDATIWYMVVATTTTQGSVSSAWYRRDPTPHRGVDTIIGSYWREAGASGVRWSGCFRTNVVTNAAAYGGRIRATGGAWVPLATPGTGSSGQLNVAIFNTSIAATNQLLAPLEQGQSIQVQLWPIIAAGGTVYGPWVPDTLHLQPLAYNVTQSATVLTSATCPK